MAFENDPEGYRMAQYYAGADFDKVKTVTHEVLRECGMKYDLTEFCALMNDLLASVPEQYRASARVFLYDPGYDGSTSFQITYVGPESAEVVTERIGDCVQYVEQRRAEERAAYERLKAKFG